MGRRHRERVYAIPPGYVHADERLTLLVLADETSDERESWAHDRKRLQELLGGVSAAWLRRRLADLEAAGLIARSPARQDAAGRWSQRRPISLSGLIAAADTARWGAVQPTPRASDGRTEHLARYVSPPSTTKRTKTGRFSPSDGSRASVNRSPVHGSRPVPARENDGEPAREIRGHYPDFPEQAPAAAVDEPTAAQLREAARAEAADRPTTRDPDRLAEHIVKNDRARLRSQLLEENRRVRVARERADAIASCEQCDHDGRTLAGDGGVMLPIRWCSHDAAVSSSRLPAVNS